MVVTPPVIHLDFNIGTLIISGLLTLIGWGLRRIYRLIKTAISEHEVTRELVDEHSLILRKAGWMKGPVRSVSKKYRARIREETT